mmetsp:Transcript_1499/g.3319  ORF Transcript_1499/g.3319 Transcript_1499/m.3319 type:complete len:347 (+) Transcript_1499:133-1173(+)
MRLLITPPPAGPTTASSSASSYSSSNSNDSTVKRKRQVAYALILGCLLFAGQVSLLKTTKAGFLPLYQVSSTGRDLSYDEYPSSSPSSAQQQQQLQQQMNKQPAHFFCLCPTRTDNCNQQFCDTILTYNDPTNTDGRSSLNLPNSTWTTARNAMYYLAKRRRRNGKIRGHAPESHYCFMDGDVHLNTSKQVVLDRLANETETNKIIAFNYRGLYNGAKYSCSMDANLNCFAEESLDRFLPYSVIKDDQAWYLSQTDLLIRAFIEEPFAFKIYDDISNFNPVHNSNYPRDGIKGSEELLQQQLSEGFSEGCFPSDEALKRKQRRPHRCLFQGDLLFAISFNRTHRFK